MKNELEQIFGDSNLRQEKLSQSYDNSLGLWNVGEMSSEEFLKVALAKLLTTKHEFRNSNHSLRTLPPEEVYAEMRNSQMLKDALAAGFNGERPEKRYEDFMGTYFRMLPYKDIYNRYKSQIISPKAKIDIWEFNEMDPKLATSLPLHFFVAEKTGEQYKKNAENSYFYKLKQAVDKGTDDEKESATIRIWLHYKGLLSRLHRYEAKSIQRLTEEIPFDGKIEFEDYDHLASSLYPLVYFFGWKKRLEDLNKDRVFTLPSYLKRGRAREVLLNTYFMYEDKSSNEKNTDQNSRNETIEKVIGSIKENGGDTTEVCEYFVQLQANAIFNNKSRPFKNWQMRNLDLSDAVKKHVTYLETGEAPEIAGTEEKPDIKQEIDLQKDEVEENEILTVAEADDVIPAETEKGNETQIPNENEVFNSTYHKAYPRKSSLDLLKESVEHSTYWLSSQFINYLYILLKGNEQLLTSEWYPDSIEIPDDWRKLLSVISNNPPQRAQRALFGISGSEVEPSFTQILQYDVSHRFPDANLFRRNDLIVTLRKDPVVADVFPDYWYERQNEEKSTLSLQTLYNHLEDNKELPLNAVTVKGCSYLLYRTYETEAALNREGIPSFTEFQRRWGESANTPLATGIERLFTRDGFSGSARMSERRLASIKACKEYKLALYEQDELTKPFHRIV